MWKTSLYNTPKTTIELRDIVGSGVDIWDFEIPLDGFQTNGVPDHKFHEDFKKQFNDHFWFREIGFETVGRFKHYLRTRVLEIMPYYNDLYNSFIIMKGIEDPFGNVNITETFSETSTGSSSGTSSGSGKTTNTASDTSQSTGSSTGSTTGSTFGTEYSSDTPQGEITYIERYMTNAKKNDAGNSSIDESNTESGSESASESESNSESSTDSSATSESEITRTTTRKGNHGVNTYAHDMIEYRDMLVNIYDRMFKDLNHLFLGVF